MPIDRNREGRKEGAVCFSRWAGYDSSISDFRPERGKGSGRKRVFNLARVTWQVGRPAEEDSRTEGAGSGDESLALSAFQWIRPTLYSFPVFSALFSVTNIIVSNNVIAFAECSAHVPSRSVIFDIVSPGTVPAAILELLMFQSAATWWKPGKARMDGFTKELRSAAWSKSIIHLSFPPSNVRWIQFLVSISLSRREGWKFLPFLQHFGKRWRQTRYCRFRYRIKSAGRNSFSRWTRRERGGERVLSRLRRRYGLSPRWGEWRIPFSRILAGGATAMETAKLNDCHCCHFFTGIKIGGGRLFLPRPVMKLYFLSLSRSIGKIK